MTDDLREDDLTDDFDDVPKVGIWKLLRELPLCDDFLGMQALNLEVVDRFLDAQESELLAEYMEEERTPFPAVVFVSALSQMWVFALYEFLRTWRQRARSVLRWAKEFQSTPVQARASRLESKKREMEKRSGDPRWAEAFHWPFYESAAKDPSFADSLRKAVDRTERLFRRIEALRVSLAKHELPGVKESYAMAPGYGRIDMMTGSIYWMVSLRGDEVDHVSRRSLADDCRRLSLDRDLLILPEILQEKLRKVPDHSYGVKRIVAVLKDGTQYGGVYIGWCKEVLQVEGHEIVPFDVDQIVEVRDDPLPPDREARG
jgi:hypothetical protein